MMSVKAKWSRWLLTAVALGCAAPALAQAPAAQPSESAMANLVRLLVEQGVITKDKGAALLQQAETEAAQARSAKPQQSAELPPPTQGTIRVPYVPETVRAQIKEELKAEVLQQARAESWASPGEGAPEWTKQIKLYGDVRYRSQSRLYSRSNSDRILDFTEINARGPVDFSGTTKLPFLNTRKDRLNNTLIRARLGLEAQIADQVIAGLEIVSGNDNSPISTNQSLGGGFGKRDLWLNKAYVQIAPNDWSRLSFGRFDNPFFSTELLYDADLKFDGVAAEFNAGKLLDAGFDLTLRGGAFPLDFGDPDNPSTEIDKRKEVQKYLFSAQVEAAAKIDKLDVRVGAAYHSFTNVQGRLSEPCNTSISGTICSNDYLRPFFLRKGNTVSFLRQIADPRINPPQPQFFGLVFDYDILNVNASIGFPITDKVPFRLTGDFVKNLAFKRSDVCRYPGFSEPFNNLGETPAGGTGAVCGTSADTPFVGGDTGWQAFATVGQTKPRKAGEWNVYGGYRYLESDAVLDSLADSEFHGGGTNAKGYFVGGGLALFDNVTVGARWLSANEVSGDPLAIDVFELDLEVAF